MEGRVYVQLETPRTRLPRVSEEAGEGSAAGTAPDRPSGEARDGSARRRAATTGSPSWRALKAELDQRQQREVARFFEACVNGDVDVLRDFLVNEPRWLARAILPRPTRAGPDCTRPQRPGTWRPCRLLLEHGADPNAREAGDNTYPLHWAAAHGAPRDRPRAARFRGRRARRWRRARARRHRLGDVLPRAGRRS